MLRTSLSAASILLILIPTAAAQQTSALQRPGFDAVSIKQLVFSHIVTTPNGPMTIGLETKSCKYLRDRVLCQLDLKRLIEEAFQRKDYEIAGPAWLNSDWYSVQATMPLDTSPDTARLMLQSALDETFHIQSHRETRLTPVYEMVPAKHGIKLKPADDPAHRTLITDHPSPTGRGAMLVMTSGQFSAVAIPMENFALNLQLFAGLDRPILNKTNLTGVYKIDLRWDPTDDSRSASQGQDPGIVDAVEQQLGLHLQKATVPLDILVLDHIDRTPAPN